jgi:hypothetical protein
MSAPRTFDCHCRVRERPGVDVDQRPPDEEVDLVTHGRTLHSTISWMERAFEGISNLFVLSES